MNIFADGEKADGTRCDGFAWSAIAAGLSWGITPAKAIFLRSRRRSRRLFTGKSRLYLGFIIVIMARQQLFNTENTVYRRIAGNAKIPP